jgi:hypothetical protein
MGRLAERIIIILFGGLSLYLGWRLFFVAAGRQNQSAEFSYKEIVLKLQRVGPGIFFAGFGALILFTGLWKNLALYDRVLNLPRDAQEAAQANDRQMTVDYMGQAANSSDDRKIIQALNFAIEVIGTAPQEPISSANHEILQKKHHELEMARTYFVFKFVGPGAFANWTKYRNNIPGAPQEMRDQVAETQRVFDDLGDLQ